MAKDIFIANQHTGGIVFPRRSDAGFSLPSLRIGPGEVKRIEGDLWDKIKKNPIVEAYLEKGILRIVKSESASVSIQEGETTDTEALVETNAPHLADAKEEGKGVSKQAKAATKDGKAGSVKASVRKAEKGQVTVD